VRFAVRADPMRFERVFLRAITGHRVDGLRPRPDVTVTFDGTRGVTNVRRLPAGNIVIRFTNRSSEPASVIILAFPGTTYRRVLRFVGPPGSVVTKPPTGIEQLALLSAGPGTRTLGRATVTNGDAGVFCVVDLSDGSARVWPGGPVVIES
jgi:hypothetical protein